MINPKPPKGQTLSEETGLEPLFHFYGPDDDALPAFHKRRGEEIPEPFRSLLVYDGDMTSKLECYHREAIALSVLRQCRKGDIYCREVVLYGAESRRPVEYGGIEIDLSLLPDQLHGVLLKGERPLGGVLLDSGIEFTSRPEFFFAIEPNRNMRASLGPIRGPFLFGRANGLYRAVSPRAQFTRVIEILAPEL